VLTQSEQSRQNKLATEKPLVYQKVQNFPNKVKNGESIAIIQLQYSYVCNMKCQHCSIHSIQQQGIKHKRRKLTPEDVKNLADQAHEMGLARFEINGGEPFVVKEYDKIVDSIGPDRFYINSVTNAWLLDLDRAKHLKSIGIDRIQIGLDSLNSEEHDEFRNKPGSHIRAMNAVDNCLSANLDVFVTTVVTKQRLYSDEFMQFIEHFNSNGVGVFMTYAKPVGSWENKFDMLVDKKDLEYAKELEKSHNIFSHLTSGYGREGGCLAIRSLVGITPYGDVMPCQYIFVSLGNIFEEPLKDIINRGMKLKPFKTETCPIAEDRQFIDKYIVNRVYGKELPVLASEVFYPEDYDEGN
jgi:MoaA/NifB/PqqE/SkfB family radical SAM enzyme